MTIPISHFVIKLSFLLPCIQAHDSEIAKITVDTIDFERDLITLEQSKTHQKLVLLLRAVVGNAVMEYLKKRDRKR